MQRSSSLAAACAAFIVAFSAVPAAAESIRQTFTADDCPDARVLTNDIVFERALGANHVTLSRLSNVGEFATSTVALLERYGNEPPESGEDLARYNLAVAALNLVTGRDNPTGRARTQVTIGPDAPTDPTTRATQFLSLSADRWLEVRCVAPPPRSAFWAGLGNVRIARDLEGAREGDVGDPSGRTFATLAGRDDRETGEQTASFEGLALFGTDWELFGNAEVETYIGYHRTSSSDDTADEINDLTFGGQLTFSREGHTDPHETFSILPAEHFFDVALWETDDELESGVTRVEIAYDPMWGGTYGNEIKIQNCLGAECSWDVTGVVDFAEVGDPGEKTALLDMDQYGRVGVDLEAGYYVTALAGEISLTAEYRIREAFTDEGDAERFTARLAYTPGDKGRISIGLDYVDGEDLTSFESEEYLAISIGFRN